MDAATALLLDVSFRAMAVARTAQRLRLPPEGRPLALRR
jgi:hypothetical protein